MTRQLAPACTRTMATIGAAALLLMGCGTPPGQFVIIQDQVPQMGCEIPATLGALYRDAGELDVSLIFDGANDGYLFFPLMQNNFPAAGSGGGDPNRIALSSFQVDVSVADDVPAPIVSAFQDPKNVGLIQFSVPTSGSVASGGGNTAGSVNAVPADLARLIRTTNVLLPAGTFFYLTATVRAQGKTLSSTVTSDPFHFPIRVCDGCLTNNLGMCPLAAAAANTGDPCNVAQDQSVDCCELGSQLVCPPVVSSQ